MKNKTREAPAPAVWLHTGITMDKKAFQEIIGQRLARLRLSIHPKLSQERLAAATHLNQNIIQRLEAGHGTIDNLLVVLNYYLQENYNLNHLLAECNEDFQPWLSAADRARTLNDYFQIPE
jgi:hypothetical protein